MRRDHTGLRRIAMEVFGQTAGMNKIHLLKGGLQTK
jgi:hypothetical protein